MRFMWGIFITCTTIRCTEGPADKCQGALKGDFIQWIPDLPLLNGHEQWPRGRFFSLWIRISPNPYLCMLGAGRFPYNSLLSGILMWACVSAFHPVMSENNVFILFQLLLCINVALKSLEFFFLGKIAGSYVRDFEGIANRAQRQMTRWWNLTNLLKIL